LSDIDSIEHDLAFIAVGRGDYMNRIVLAFWIAINAGPASQSGQKSFGLWQEAVITFRVRQGDQDVDSGSKQNFFPETVAHGDPSVGFDALSQRYRSDLEVHADAVSLGPRQPSSRLPHFRALRLLYANNLEEPSELNEVIDQMVDQRLQTLSQWRRHRL
jgi:hypothetical protein